METKITATELARNLSDILNRVRYKGESFRVERNGETVAVLGPGPKKGITWGEFAERWDAMEKPDSGFWDDVEEAHRLMNQPVVSRWGDDEPPVSSK
jgi:prevent-host-death family protein